MLDFPAPSAQQYDASEMIADLIFEYSMIINDPRTESSLYFDEEWARYAQMKIGCVRHWGAALLCAYDSDMQRALRHIDMAIELDLEAICMEIERTKRASNAN